MKFAIGSDGARRAGFSSIGRPRRPYIVTFLGERIPLTEPRPEHIHVVDIEHALRVNMRFTGHGSTPFSVAAHCVMTSMIARACGADLELQRWALFHDASEAYLGDVSSPLKSLLPAYRALESTWQAAIAERFGLVCADVLAYDRLALACEVRVCGPALTDDEIGEITLTAAGGVLTCAQAYVACAACTSFTAFARELGFE